MWTGSSEQCVNAGETQSEEFCEPLTMTCPLTCKADERICYLQDYDPAGVPLKERQACEKRSTPCKCGLRAQRCHDPQTDEYFCYPLRDMFTNTSMQCPVFCKADEEYCYVDSYSASGRWLSVTESCVKKGQPCDCSQGQNARSCNFTDPWQGHTAVRTSEDGFGNYWQECIALKGGWCPPTCASGQITCPEVENFMPNGTSTGWSAPPKSCAANYDACGCGREAKNCGGWVGCVFKDCTHRDASCRDTQHKCWLNDFDTNGEWISYREVCIPQEGVSASRAETCPCGTNTLRCPGEDICLPASQASVVCPCKESQKQCDVMDYTSTGTLSGMNTVCVAMNTKCPCGKNTLTCSDPNDAEDNLCEPKYAGSVLNKCPKPCTPDDEAQGNKTCVQSLGRSDTRETKSSYSQKSWTHLSSTGDFLSETISCTKECPPGRNMKKCASGAVVPAWKQCQDFYKQSGNATEVVSAGEKQTSKVTPSRQRDARDARRAWQEGVAQQAKKMVTRQSPGMKSALDNLGSVNVKAGVATATTTSKAPGTTLKDGMSSAGGMRLSAWIFTATLLVLHPVMF
eukprot:g6176.t1